jgi:hypothetical protein
MSKIFIMLLAGLLVATLTQAQCSSGEVEVQIEIITDAYGSEGYWELVNADSACGQGTILSGGNTIVGCGGAGNQNQPTGGYSSNSIITSDTACLMENESYRIAYVDDWGDGGFEFLVFINGFLVKEFEGSGSFEYFTFEATEPPSFDLVMLHAHVPAYQPQGSIDIEAEVYNAGTTTITSLDLAYTINGGTSLSQTVSGLSIPNGARAHITHPSPWTPTTDGDYDLVLSHSNLNGSNIDANPNDDEVEATVTIGPGRPNVIDSYLVNLPIVVEIADGSEQVNMPTDLDFHPTLSRNELWVLNKDLENTGSSTVTISNAGMSNQSEQWRRDGNAWHFMSMSTGIVFSENGNFGTSPGIFDANHNGGQAFTGPALWSSDPAIYAQPSGGNGSHLDMLHQSPECQGIAHEIDNVFWVFDGYNKDIVRYDFVADHGPGNSEHGDAVVLRYSDENVKADSDDEVPSHLAYDKETDWLYVVDHGNERVFKIDTKSGTLGGTPSYGPYEPLAEYRNVTGYDWVELVDSGLVQPAGIALMEDFMLVSDFFTGEIIIYDKTTEPATELKRLALEAEGIMGITIGPAGKIWYVDYEDESVNRIDWVPDTTVGITNVSHSKLKFYPNPSHGKLTIENDQSAFNVIQLIDNLGKVVYQGMLISGQNELNINAAPGAYYLNTYSTSTNEMLLSKLIIK